MIKLIILPFICILTSCSSVPTQLAVNDPREAIAIAIATCATAIERVASSNADTTSKVVAYGAIERMCANGNNMQTALAIPPPQPQSLGQTLWMAALQTADIVLRGYGIRVGRDVAINSSNNAMITAVSSYNTLSNIASSGFSSNTAIAANIKSPAPNITTINNTTLSGSGVIGSGSYVINRNCNGGIAGSSNAGILGGNGGNANGGNC